MPFQFCPHSSFSFPSCGIAFTYSFLVDVETGYVSIHLWCDGIWDQHAGDSSSLLCFYNYYLNDLFSSSEPLILLLTVCRIHLAFILNEKKKQNENKPKTPPFSLVSYYLLAGSRLVPAPADLPAINLTSTQITFLVFGCCFFFCFVFFPFGCCFYSF